jgi:hypothetical protein
MSNPIKEIFNLIEKEKDLNKLVLDNLNEQKKLKTVMDSKADSGEVKSFSVGFFLFLFLAYMSYGFFPKIFTDLMLIISLIFLFCLVFIFFNYIQKHIVYSENLSKLKKAQGFVISDYSDMENQLKVLRDKHDKIKSELGLIKKETIKLVDSIDSETILNYISKNEINNQEFIILDNILNSKIYMAKEKNSNKKNLLKNKINKLNSIESETLNITNE